MANPGIQTDRLRCVVLRVEPQLCELLAALEAEAAALQAEASALDVEIAQNRQQVRELVVALGSEEDALGSEEAARLGQQSVAARQHQKTLMAQMAGHHRLIGELLALRKKVAS
jgi:flagellar biosynthesis/type III secretory pathway protein FliH